MALNEFSVLLLVSAAPEVFAELKGAIYTVFCALILRLKLSHNTIENKVYNDLWLPHYIIFQIRKRNEWTGQKS